MDGGRDEFHRVTKLPDLLGLLGASLVVGILAMVGLDGGLALAGAGDFGHMNGWLALILPAWLFIEEFRAWRSAGAAPLAVTLAALLALVLAMAAGILTASALATLANAPALASGTGGATACSVGYALVWFYAIRRITGEDTSSG